MMRSAQDEEFLKLAAGVPMPSLVKPVLLATALGGILGQLFAKKPLKWALISGATTGVLGTVAEASFAGGMAMCMQTMEEIMSEKRATTRVPHVRLPGGGETTATVVWPVGVPAPPPGYFDQPPHAAGWW
jgi:hypothetical protein